ncbi:MAG: hypothetical protein P8Z37_19665 [Acidobacteriota bacterium]|jgi:hypothetical protein
MLKTMQVSSAFFLLAFLLASMSAAAAQETERDSLDDYIVTLPEGTVLPIVLTAYLNTKNNQPGDIVYATTIYPIWHQQKLVIPKGSEIRGTLTEVVRPGRIKGKGRIAIRFDDILLPNGVRRELSATFRGIHGPGEESLDRETESIDGGGSKGEDAKQIAVLTSQGASVGMLAGGLGAGRPGAGAAIGAGAGAAAGIATVLLTRGKDLVLEPGTQFDLELLEPMEFSYYELEFSNTQLDDARESARPAPPPRSYGESNINSGRPGLFPGIGFPF